MDILKLTEEEFAKILLSKANEEEEKYWISSIKRARPDRIEGTVVEIGNMNEPLKTSTVIFEKFSLSIEGELNTFVSDIKSAYTEILLERSEEYQDYYKTSMAQIDEQTAVFRARLVEAFEENGFVKNDIKCMLSGKGATDLAKRVATLRHGEFIAPFENKHFKANRKFKVGEIYSANLNPAHANEFAGIRPVVIISESRKTVNIVPLTHLLGQSDEQDKHIFISKETYPELTSDSEICTEIIKDIDKSRIYEKITRLDAEDMDKVIEMVGKRVLGERFAVHYDDLFAGEYLDESTTDIFNPDELDLGDKEVDVEEDKVTIEEEKPVVATAESVTDEKSAPKAKKPISFTTGRQDDGVLLFTSDENGARYVDGRPLAGSDFVAVDPNRIAFELTDEEAIAITQEKNKISAQAGSKLVMRNPKVVKNEGLNKGVVVVYNDRHTNDEKGMFLTTFTIYPFSVNFECGEKFIKDEKTASRILAEKMMEKYGDDYGRAYFASNLVYLRNRNQRYGNPVKCAELLEEKLTYINKTIPNSLEAITKNYHIAYEDLIDGFLESDFFRDDEEQE